MKIFEENLELEGIVVERAHRAAASLKQKRDNMPRTIVLKLLNYKDKTNIMKTANKLKGSGIYINEDFSKETTEKRKRLWNDIKRLRDEGKFAILQYDRIVTKEFKK